MNIKYLLAVATPLFVASIFSSCDDDDDDDGASLNSYQETKEFGERFLMELRKEDGIIESSTGLLFKVNVLGTGVRPEDGDTVYAVITGNKIEGKKNEFCYDTINSTTFGKVKALQEGIKYMTVGSDFDFWAPYYLAYGTVSYTGVSRNPVTSVTVNPYSAVKFNVKLLGVKKEDK